VGRSDGAQVPKRCGARQDLSQMVSGGGGFDRWGLVGPGGSLCSRPISTSAENRWVFLALKESHRRTQRGVRRDGGVNGPRSQLRWNRPALEGDGPLCGKRIHQVGAEAARIGANSSRERQGRGSPGRRQVERCRSGGFGVSWRLGDGRQVTMCQRWGAHRPSQAGSGAPRPRVQRVSTGSGARVFFFWPPLAGTSPASIYSVSAV